MSRVCRRLWLALVLGFAMSHSVSAHNYFGLEHPALVRARVQSPNASTADFPLPIPGTDLSVVCFRIRNSGEFDSRITAMGVDVPGDRTGYTLISPTNTTFHLVEQVAGVPALRGVVLDFALLTGRTFGGGHPDAGLPPSSELVTVCISGPFPRDVPIERLLDQGVLRLQRVGVDGELSDVAVWENRSR